MAGTKSNERFDAQASDLWDVKNLGKGDVMGGGGHDNDWKSNVISK